MSDDAVPASVEQVEQLLDDSWGVPEGPAQIALTREAVRLADATGDEELAFRARRRHLTACEFGGDPEEALVAFAWCLGAHDRQPEQFPELLWEYKWIAVSLPDQATVPRHRIDAVLDDMEHRFRRAGASLVAPAKARWRASMALGEADLALDWHARWRSLLAEQTRRDGWADCPACDVAEEAALLAILDRDAEAAEVAEPVLGGRLSCHVVPEFTFGELVVPVLRLGRTEMAEHMHREGYARTRTNPLYIRPMAGHLTYRWMVGDTAGALDLCVHHLGWLVGSTSDVDRWWYAAAARRLLAELDPATPITQPLPAALVRALPTGPPTVASLHDWVDDLAVTVTDHLDRRNGNDWYRQALDRDPRAAH